MALAHTQAEMAKYLPSPLRHRRFGMDCALCGPFRITGAVASFESDSAWLSSPLGGGDFAPVPQPGCSFHRREGGETQHADTNTASRGAVARLVRHDSSPLTDHGAGHPVLCNVWRHYEVRTAVLCSAVHAGDGDVGVTECNTRLLGRGPTPTRLPSAFDAVVSPGLARVISWPRCGR